MLFWQAVYIVYLTIQDDKIDRWLAKKNRKKLENSPWPQASAFSNISSILFFSPSFWINAIW